MSNRSRTKHEIRKPKRKRILLALGWYATGLHRGVAAYAKKAGWVLNIEMERALYVPGNWTGAGVICLPGMSPGLDEAIFSWQIPTVTIGPVEKENLPSVTPDNEAIGELAFEHFHERGFRHFAFYSRSGGIAEQQRHHAFRRRVEEAGYTLHHLDWAGERNPAETATRQVRPKWMDENLKALPKPVAIFSEFDDRALEVLNACEMAGLSIPEEVAILGVDNDDLRCTFSPVPLSSIDDDQVKQGYEAARLLDEILRGEKPDPFRVRIPPLGVVTRESTDILAIDHPNVAKALRIIWDHYTEELTAEAVAHEIPMSARRLHDAFVRHVGRTMAEEITRRRLDHAKRLLEDKEWRKMEDIAERSGFTSGDHMCKVFSRTLGVNPSSYRRDHTQAHTNRNSS